MSNIYLLSQSVNRGYDTYDSMIVVAESEETARNMKPTNNLDAWCYPEDIQVELIGSANEPDQRIILTSFNAG